MKIGPYRVSTIVSHSFGLDGGAMFGVVPKVLWQKVLPADERNRIPMVTRLLLLESSDSKILIDLGCGDKLTPKMRDIYDCKRMTPLPLHEFLPDLTHVIITHFHFDHLGGVSYRDDSGELQLSFPNAEHIFSKRHADYSSAPNVRERASFYTENLEPLLRASKRLVKCGDEVLPNIRVWESNGHTTGMCAVKIFDDTQTLAFPTDIVPTSHHLPLPYTMGYDMCAKTMIEEKREFLDLAIEHGWIVVFEHDREVAAAKIELRDGRAVIKELVQLPVYAGGRDNAGG